MRVGLAGGGIGGMAAALALARRGVEPILLERAPAFAEVGAGLQLSPNATRILIRWGLEPALRAAGFRPEAAEVREHATGRRLLRVELGSIGERRWRAPYLQLHRADLHTILADAARSAGAIVRLGAAVHSFTQDETGVDVATGDESFRVDGLIGCDGIRSTVAAALVGEAPARFTGELAWRALVPVERLPLGAVPPFGAVWTGRGRHFVHYPVRGGGLINLVGVVERADWIAESWTAAGDPAAFRADFAGWPEPVAALLAATDEVWRFAIHDRPPRPQWGAGRVSLLGDAAHPAPPFLAQGAAMAIEDAEALAHHLSSGKPVEAALRAYEAERRPRTRRVLAWSRRNARLFHLGLEAAAAVFGLAALLGTPAERLAGTHRLDWLYGYDRAG